ncbi:MAG: cell division protein FtsA, partial [Beijerinckiaceae bacterium]
MSDRSFAPPRLKALSARRSATICVLDIGTTKIACLIGRLAPIEGGELLRGRTHRCQVLGIGVQRARGIKGGVVVDMEEAEDAIRHAVDAAERMAKLQVESLIVNLSGGRLASQRHNARIALSGAPVGDAEIHRAVEAAACYPSDPARSVLHSLPTGFSLDGATAVREPKGMVGTELGAQLHVVSCDSAAVRNTMLAVERCHLEIEAVVASPYAAGLSVLVDDEIEMGTIVVDLGGGTTSVASFAG